MTAIREAASDLGKSTTRARSVMKNQEGSLEQPLYGNSVANVIQSGDDETSGVFARSYLPVSCTNTQVMRDFL